MYTVCTVLYYVPVWLLGSRLGEKIINLPVVGINVENILSASAVPLCNVHPSAATSQENKQSEENSADISAKTLFALGAVHKSPSLPFLLLFLVGTEIVLSLFLVHPPKISFLKTWSKIT